MSILGLSSETAIPVNVELDGRKWSVKSAAPGDQYKVWPLKVSRAIVLRWITQANLIVV